MKVNSFGLNVFIIAMSISKAAFASGDLEELNSKFTFHGQPIHPFLIGNFIGNLADDRPPMIASVDVAAAFDTNAYMNSEIKNENGDFVATHKGEDAKDVPEDYEEYGYKRLGVLDKNVQVVEIWENGGGSGVFTYLLLLNFSQGRVDWGGKKAIQLLMNVLGIYDLGDRYDGNIKVNSNEVIVLPSQGQYGGGAVDRKIIIKNPLET